MIKQKEICGRGPAYGGSGASPICRPGKMRGPVSSKDVDRYIANAPMTLQPKLKELRRAISEVAPKAQESISYRMPHYSYKGRLAWFAPMKNHIGLYLRPPVIAEHRRDLAAYKTTKSAVHFPLDRKLPVPLIKKLVRARMKKNEAEM